MIPLGFKDYPLLVDPFAKSEYSSARAKPLIISVIIHVDRKRETDGLKNLNTNTCCLPAT